MTWLENMCSITSESSNSDTASTCFSDSEIVDAEDPEEFSIHRQRRSTRVRLNTMCSIASESSNSDTASTCSSDSETVDAEDPKEFSINRHRRSTRGARGLEEKSTEWKIVHLPVFQDWAQKSVFLQEALPVPEALEGIRQDGASLPEPEARLPQSKRMLTRSSSASMERLLSVEPLVGQKDSEGVLRS